jgi:hypothetical protein
VLLVAREKKKKELAEAKRGDRIEKDHSAGG